MKPGGRPREAIVADLRARLGVLPVSVNVGQPISHRLDHMLSGVRAEIALKLFGEDLDGLRRTAEALKTAFETIPGIADLPSRSRSASRSSRSGSIPDAPPSTASPPAPWSRR